MTTATADPKEELYDPDNPPEDRGFLGRFTITAHVDGDTVTPSQGAETDARIIEACQKYAASASNYTGPLWFIEGEGVDVTRSDGQPFRQHDIIKLKSAKGANLGGSQAPDLMASAFRDLGVTASYTKVGESNSAVGRIFDFGSKDLKLGGGFKKPVRMFPRAIMDEGFVYDGEVRIVTPRNSEGEAAADGGVSAGPSEAEALDILKATLTGKTPAEMMQAIIDETRLATVPTVFGVALLEAATDETLVQTLTENKFMALAEDGTLQPVAA